MLSYKSWWITALLCSRVSGSLVDDIVNALKNAADCGSCHALLLPLQGLSHLGDSAFSGTIEAVCDSLGVEDADVCAGAIGQQGPIIANNLRSISAFGQTATKLCDTLLGLCQAPAVNAYTVPFPKATPTNPQSFHSTGRTPFQVVHFSDVHIDRQYVTGADADCTKPICCRNYAGETSPANAPAGPFGNHKCDTPVSLAQSMLQAISANNQFSIFTGDVVEAAVWLVDQNEATNDLNDFNNEMSTILGAPVFPAIGNHEAAPVNAFPRNTTSKANAQWVFDTQSRGWAEWISSDGANQVSHMSGSYSVVAPGTNLRVISLNTLYWYKSNFWLYDSDTTQPDPNGILAFTIQELQAAEDAGQRAWIIGHMPPGSQDALHDQSNYFDQIVQRYRNTIAGQFYGHSHQDEFEIGYSDYTNQVAENAVSIAWIAPSLTPRSGNPAFKVYDVDPDTYEIMDARVFISDMSNPAFQTNPTWEQYYSARETYGPLTGLSSADSLSPTFWHQVTEAFSANDDAFQKYISFKTRGVDVSTCDADCKNSTICGLRAMRAEDNCHVSTPGLNFRKRSTENPSAKLTHDDACEGAGLGHIFSRVLEKISDPSFDLEALKARMAAVLLST